MARKSFWEMMEREIDFQEEYEKIEDVIIQQEHAESLDDLIETVFGKWEQRKNYMSFWELRLHMNFTYSQTQRYPTEYVPDRNDIKMEDFLLYSEMILNMLELLNRETHTIYLSKIQLIQKTIVYDLEKINYKAVKQKNGEIIIIQKDAAVSVVVDFVESDVAQILIKYNHYLLKGDLEKKKEILKKIADALEPKRKQLNAINSIVTSDFFFMVNKMNIRHNNCDSSDKSNYVEVFDKMTKIQKENWYDAIYQQGLMLFMVLKQEERSRKIKELKHSL